MAGLRVREKLGCSIYMGLVSDPNLHIPGHPTSKGDLGVTEGFKKCYLPVTTVWDQLYSALGMALAIINILRVLLAGHLCFSFFGVLKYSSGHDVRAFYACTFAGAHSFSLFSVPGVFCRTHFLLPPPSSSLCSVSSLVFI